MRFKTNFTVPTKDFKGYESVDLWVNSSFTEDGDAKLTWRGDVEYTITIPDFMFDALADTESKFTTEYDHNNHEISGLFSDKTVTRKFKKTQTSLLLSNLREYISDLSTHLVEKHSIETATLKKKIFIYFNHSQAHKSNGLNGAYWGESIGQTFYYFIGYEVMTDKFNTVSLNWEEGKKPTKRYISKTFYMGMNKSVGGVTCSTKEQENLFLPLPAHNQSVESFEKQFSIVDWSEEREAFCEKIRQTFVNVNTELSKFLKDLDTIKFDHLIEANPLKFLN